MSTTEKKGKNIDTDFPWSTVSLQEAYLKSKDWVLTRYFHNSF